MRALIEFASRLRSIFKRERLDRDIAEQMRLHVEMQADANARAGMPPAEALRLARLQFGSIDRFSAECRDARRFGIVEDAARDARFALRGLSSERTFTVAALVALTVGVGAATTIYSLADHVLLRPVAGVSQPDQLVTVLFERESYSSTAISLPNLLDLAEAVPAFTAMAGVANASLHGLGEGAPVVLNGEVVAGDYFGVLRVTPALGRFFSIEEVTTTASDANVAVISHALWQRLYGGAGEVLGSGLRLNTHNFVIIGVAPPNFRGPKRLGNTDVWLPGAAYEAVRHYPHGHMTDRGAGVFTQVIGRLSPGASPALAQAQLRYAMAELVQQYPLENASHVSNVPTVHAGIGTPPSLRTWTSRTMRVLGGAALLVLLIACANVANLLLFRSTRRRGELALRRALGADNRRLLRQHLVEGGLLAAAGSTCGMLLSIVTIRWLRNAEVRSLPPLHELTVDPRVILFAVILVLLTGVFFGVIGTWWARNTALQPRIRYSSGTSAAVEGRIAFTIVQVSASVVLLACSLLLIRSVGELRANDIGMDPNGVAVFGVRLESHGYAPPQWTQFLQSVLAPLSADNRLQTVAVATAVPVIGITMSAPYRLPDEPFERSVRMRLLYVSDEYFAALGMQFIAGRTFQKHEAFAEHDGELVPVVISAAAANNLYGSGHAAIGRQLATAGIPDGPLIVIGVTSDVRASLREPPEPAIFLPLGVSDRPRGAAYIVVKSTRPVDAVERIVQDAVSLVEPTLPFWTAGGLREQIGATLATERLLAAIIAGFALVANLLATVGLYGIVAYAVAQQRRQIGIRAALGATPIRLAAFVAQNALLATAIGAMVGVAGAVLASRLLESWLYGVNRLDPLFYLTAASGFVLLALLAAAVPAYRAARTQPSETLRIQ